MAKINLVSSVFDRQHPFKVAILCSFGLDLNFFENYILNLNALYACDQISLFVDQGTYDGFIDASYVPRLLNKRYLVTPVRTRGVFHTKLYILASEKKTLIGLGSPNLTRDGIASNLELLSTFEVSKSKQEFAPLLIGCINYVQRIAQETQSKQAIERADELAVLCSSYLADPEECALDFVHNLDRPLLSEIQDAVAGKRINYIQVISPFYDAQLKPLQTLQAQLPACRFEFFLQQKKSNFPLEVKGVPGELTAVSIYKGIDRYLHGKAILVCSEDETFLYMGSANFTNPALLQTAQNGNYEIGVIGPLRPELASEILQPAGHEAQPVASLNEVEINEDREFEARTRAGINYLIEANLNANRITYHTNADISTSLFRPEKYLLQDFAGNLVEGTHDSGSEIEIPAAARKRLLGQIALQILGSDDNGDPALSNLVWVIDLDERSGDRRQRRMRRIFADPGQLYDVLEEIANEGDERELMLFLKKFDIPLDLMLPPRTSRGVRNIGTKGNIVGELPTHHSAFFSSTVLDAYDDLLNRLSRKMKHHLNNVQPDKIGNFLLLLNSSQTLLNFISTWARDKYLLMQTISGEDWLTIRDSYDMLLKHSNALWEIVWSAKGYRNAVNARLAELHEENEAELDTFEQYLLFDYGKSVEDYVKYTMDPVETFAELKEQLLIKTVDGKLTKPKVFSNRHLYLEPLELERLTAVLALATPRLMQMALG